MQLRILRALEAVFPEPIRAAIGKARVLVTPPTCAEIPELGSIENVRGRESNVIQEIVSHLEVIAVRGSEMSVRPEIETTVLRQERIVREEGVLRRLETGGPTEGRLIGITCANAPILRG